MSNTRSINDVAYVLHGVPYKETSLICELFCREHGRLPVVAKGAKRPHSGLRPVLVSFQPLSVRFTGKAEVKTLTHAEWQGGQMAPDGKALFAAYYLNELLMRGLGREDSHVELFDLYQETLLGLSHGQDMNVCVRRFEVGLLKTLGYGLDWSADSSGRAIDLNEEYAWVEEQGWVSPSGGGVAFSENKNVKNCVKGEIITLVHHGQWSKTVASALKPVTRRLLVAHVAPNGLLSKVWMEHLLKI